MSKREFLLRYLGKHKNTSSWDWPADVEYGEEFFGLNKLGDSLLKSEAPAPLRMAVHYSEYDKIKKDRLRELRKLVKEGLVFSAWVGLGAGSKSEFGTNRTRGYSLTPEGIIELKILL